MKLILPLLLLVGTISKAWAIRPITSEENRKIQTQIGRATDIDYEIQQTNEKANDKSKTPEERAVLLAKIPILENARITAYNKAIWMTIEYYEILPPNQASPKGTIVRKSPNKGDDATWLPIFDDHNEHDVVDADGKLMGKDKFSDSAGIASSDGTSRIFPDNFISPAWLASTIIHEKEHFDQYTTKGKGDVLTPGELEPPAIDKELDLQKQGVLSLPDWQVDAWKKNRLKYRREKVAQGQAERDSFNRTGVMPTSTYPKPLVGKELSKIQNNANELRIQVGKEIAVGTFQSIAVFLCTRFPDWVTGDFATRDLDYRTACAAFQNKQASHSWPDPTRGAMGVCGSKVTEILSRCEEPDQIAADLREAVGLNQPAPPAPIPAPQPGIPSPGDVGQRLHEAERQRDGSKLTNDYQEMAAIAENLCEDPNDLGAQSSAYCAYEMEASGLISKYRQLQEDPPANWSDVNYSRCAGELLGFIENPFTNLCGGATDMRAIVGKVRSISQKYNPTPTNPQPTNPQPRPNPTPRDPNWSCPAGCTCPSPGHANCPPSPLP